MPRVDEPKTETLNLRIPAPLATWLREQASAEAMPISEFARYLLLTAKRART